MLCLYGASLLKRSSYGKASFSPLSYPSFLRPVKNAKNVSFLLGAAAVAFILTIICSQASIAKESAGKPRHPFINKIQFVGNKSITDKELKSRMYTKEPSFFAIFTKPRLKESYIRRDIAFIEAYYHSQGFFEAKVKLKDLKYSKDKRFVDIIIEVDEGEVTMVKEVLFSPTPIVDTKKLTKKLLLGKGKAFNPSLLETDVYTIKNEFAKKGYPAASIEDSLVYVDHTVSIRYVINSGPRIKIRGIEIKGNRMTKNSIVRQELTIKEGEVFNVDKLLESRRNLFDTGLFTEVEIKPGNIDLKNRVMDIVTRVRERKATYVEFGFGIGNILGSRVLAELGQRNLFGTGRKLKLKAQYSFDLFRDDDVDFNRIKLRKKYLRYDGEFDQRHLFGSKILIGINAFYEEDATVEPISIATAGASALASRRLSRFTDILVSLSHDRITRESPDIPTEKSISRIFSSSITRDKRDFILNPSRGSYRHFRIQVAGGILGGDNDFYSMTLSLQKYFATGRNNVAAFRLRIGYADAFGDSRNEGVPVENRFFTGGGNSVRGYRENSLGPKGAQYSSSELTATGGVVGGRVLLLTNAELRFRIPYLSKANISGALFLDGGNVWGSLREVKLRYFRPYVEQSKVEASDYRYSLGFGLRYNTPVGPIRLDYGIPVKREPWMNGAGRFHVSLGQIF